MAGATNKQGPRRIDVHTHLIPPAYVELLATIGVTGTPGRAFPRWSPQKTLKVMDRNGIEQAIVSVSSPGVRDAALARAVNEYAAQLIADHPGRFGAFATLPLPEIEAAMGELAHALDTLKLDGVILFSNVDGVYFGNPELDPILKELDSRGATVLVHANDGPAIGTNAALDPFVEYPMDVARAYAHLVFGQAFVRFPSIRFIFANAGGVVPFLAERIGKLHYLKGEKIRWGRVIVDLVLKRNSGRDQAMSVSYDVADACNRFTLSALRKLVDPSQILFGSNYPYAPEATISSSIEALGEPA